MVNTESETRAQQQVAGPLSQKAGEQSGVTVAGAPGADGPMASARAEYTRGPDGEWRRTYAGAWTPPMMTGAEQAQARKEQLTAAHEHSIAVNQWQADEARKRSEHQAAYRASIDAEQAWLNEKTNNPFYTVYERGPGPERFPGDIYGTRHLDRTSYTDRDYEGLRPSGRPGQTSWYSVVYSESSYRPGFVSTGLKYHGQGTAGYARMVRQNPDDKAIGVKFYPTSRLSSFYGVSSETGSVRPADGRLHYKHAAWRRANPRPKASAHVPAPKPVLRTPIFGRRSTAPSRPAGTGARRARPAPRSTGVRRASSYRNPRTSAGGLSIGSHKEGLSMGRNGRSLSFGGKKKKGLSL